MKKAGTGNTKFLLHPILSFYSNKTCAIPLHQHHHETDAKENHEHIMILHLTFSIPCTQKTLQSRKCQHIT